PRARGSGDRPVRRAGDRAEVLRDAGRGPLVGAVGGRQPQPGDLRRSPGPRRRAARGAEGGGRAVKVTLCDVGPRDGLQNEAQTLEPAVRAELVNRLAAAGLPRIEAV